MFTYKYPHPAVTTDSVVFGFDGKILHVLLIKRKIDPFKGSWALPGGFMKMDETLGECARRELREETGVHLSWLKQFHAFSSVGRDPRERVVSVGYWALVRQSDYRLIAGDDAAEARWFPLENLPELAFDHAYIIEQARKHIREEIRLRPIAFKLLDKVFTMPELQRVWEAISGQNFDRRNFSRKILATGKVKTVEDEWEEEEIQPKAAPQKPKSFMETLKESLFKPKVKTTNEGCAAPSSMASPSGSTAADNLFQPKIQTVNEDRCCEPEPPNLFKPKIKTVNADQNQRSRRNLTLDESEDLWDPDSNPFNI